MSNKIIKGLNEENEKLKNQLNKAYQKIDYLTNLFGGIMSILLCFIGFDFSGEMGGIIGALLGIGIYLFMKR